MAKATIDDMTETGRGLIHTQDLRKALEEWPWHEEIGPKTKSNLEDPVVAKSAFAIWVAATALERVT